MMDRVYIIFYIPSLNQFGIRNCGFYHSPGIATSIEYAYEELADDGYEMIGFL